MTIREGIILAAGRGTRLRDYIRVPKPLAPLGRFRLIHFPIFSLKVAGVEKLIMVVRRVALRFVSKLLGHDRDIEHVVVVNEMPYRENGYSLYLGIENTGGRFFFVSMADHIYPPKVPQKLLRDLDVDTDILVAADSMPRFIDIREATKIFVESGRVKRIGKNIHRFQYIDAGLFIMNRSIRRLVASLVKEFEILRVSDIINHAIDDGYIVRVSDITGLPWIDVDTPKEINKVLYGEASLLINTIIEKMGGINEPG
mgnify:CR=1 FL=1